MDALRIAQLTDIAKLYTKTSAAVSISNGLLQECCELEQTHFGTTRNDSDNDAAIDGLEYSSGGGQVWTWQDVAKAWGEE